MLHLGIALAVLLAATSCDKPNPPAPAPSQTNAATAAQAKPEPKFAVKKFTRDIIPPGLETLSQPIGGLSFSDSLGEHIVVLSQDDATRSIRLLHALVANGAVARVLHRHDVTPEGCEWDFFANFELGALGVTDTDGDDTGEVTVMFKHGCMSDMSAKDAELWVLEGETRRTLRGDEILMFPEEEPIGTGKATDEGFEDAPQLLEQAREVWRKHVLTEVRDTAEREPPTPTK